MKRANKLSLPPHSQPFDAFGVSLSTFLATRATVSLAPRFPTFKPWMSPCRRNLVLSFDARKWKLSKIQWEIMSTPSYFSPVDFGFKPLCTLLRPMSSSFLQRYAELLSLFRRHQDACFTHTQTSPHQSNLWRALKKQCMRLIAPWNNLNCPMVDFSTLRRSKSLLRQTDLSFYHRYSDSYLQQFPESIAYLLFITAVLF